MDCSQKRYQKTATFCAVLNRKLSLREDLSLKSEIQGDRAMLELQVYEGGFMVRAAFIFDPKQAGRA